MPLTRRAGFLLKHALLWAAVAMGVFILALTAIGFLMAAIYLALAPHLGAAAAAALTGALLLLGAFLLASGGFALLTVLRKRPPSLAADLAESLGMVVGTAAAAVKREPGKALLISVLAGLLTDLLTRD